MTQLIKCRTCGKEVSMNALTCPHCGEPYPARSIVCPKCGSDEIAVHGRKGFSTGKALVGAILAGPLGVAAGGLGHQNILLTCANCGYNWQATSQQLQAQLAGKQLLEVGATMTGVVLSVNKSAFNLESSLTVDLGSGRFGTLNLNTINSNINRSRRRRGLTPIAQGDSIEIRIVGKLPRGNLGVAFGYPMNYPAASGRGIKKHCEQNAPRGGESNPKGLKLVDRWQLLSREEQT